MNVKNSRNIKIAVLFVAIIAAAAVAALIWKDRGSTQPTSAGTTSDEDSIFTVEIGGEKYKPKTRVKTYLFIGVDEQGAVDDDENAGVGQCDVLELVIIDQNADTYTLLPINRNTITAVKSLEDDGTYIATSDVQIALAHANGDGKEISCENTVDAVSEYLNGQQIDGYVALNMDAIGVINRMAGGVTVTIEDDFSQVDSDLVMGATITLSDTQAETFVRGRNGVADGTNENRMKRQSVYLHAAEEIYRQKLSEDETYVMDVYDALTDYMVTNLSKNDFSKLAKAMLKNTSLGELEITGEVSTDYLGFRQFVPDESSLEETIAKLFYEKQ
jgi:anionic cell wall polymer biosynthesis LytR-Cps2A-Psr (LCP) family protein